MSAVVLFDGVCNFCDASVNFIIEHDRKEYFKFAPLQSDEGRRLADNCGFASATSVRNEPPNDLISIDSIILVEEGRCYSHSTAALRILRRLGAPWSWSYAMIILPDAIRDFCYKLFAKYRYRFFGRKEQCMIPTPEVRSRFLA